MQLVEEAILERDFQTLAEIILKFPFFEELSAYLPETIFQELITNISFEIIVRREPLTLDPGTFYFFFERGLIRKRDAGGKSSKSVRSTKNKSWFTMVSKAPVKAVAHDFKGTFIEQIQEYDCYVDMQSVTNKYVQNVFQNYSGKPSIVLTVVLELLPPHINQQIRHLFQDKIKDFHQIDEFKSIPLTLLSEKEHKFRYLQLQFGQTLTGKGIRNNCVFFVKDGSIEVFLKGKRTSSFLLGPKSIIGLRSSEVELARCVSEKVHCYFMDSEQFFLYFPSLKQETVPVDSLDVQQSIRLSVRSPFGSCHSSPYFSDVINCAKSPKTRQTQGAKGHAHKMSMEELESSKKRVDLLRRKLPNYYNDIFGNFSDRKVQKLGLKLGDQENLRLFDLNIKEKKSPEMSQIKSRLHKKRIDKFLECKQKILLRGRGKQLSPSGGVVIFDHP